MNFQCRLKKKNEVSPCRYNFHACHNRKQISQLDSLPFTKGKLVLNRMLTLFLHSLSGGGHFASKFIKNLQVRKTTLVSRLYSY